jgi:hypothetical protein
LFAYWLWTEATGVLGLNVSDNGQRKGTGCIWFDDGLVNQNKKFITNFIPMAYNDSGYPTLINENILLNIH